MKYIISIPEPCDEKWDEMTPTEQGRFCAVCAKEIYDFTQISNRELVNKLKNKENICARYRKDQLDVDLYANSNTGLSRMGLLFSLTSLFAVSQPALAQDNSSVTTTEQQSQIDNIKEDTKVVSDSITVRGIVSDGIGVIPGASVKIKGTTIKILTDFDGKFKLTASKQNLKIGTVLIAEYAGESQSIVLENLNKEIAFDIKVNIQDGVTVIGTTIREPNHYLTGYVVQTKTTQLTTVKKRKSIFTRIANVFRKKENKR